MNNPTLVSAQNLFGQMQKANTVANLAKAAQANQQVTANAPRAPMAANRNGKAAYVPQPLPSVANPTQTFEAMPTMGTSLPTSTSSYQTLLHNMLANSQNPMDGLSGSTMPGAGGSMNPSVIIPGMY
ncbi:hypothetical protein [Paraburkholderia graminis]